jgi:hypothetical protein
MPSIQFAEGPPIAVANQIDQVTVAQMNHELSLRMYLCTSQRCSP